MGSTITSQGIGSGLDIATMVENLVKADISPLQEKHDKKLNSVNTEISAIGQLKSALSTLKTSMSSLSNLSQYYKMKFTLSDQNFFSTKISEKAQAGVYQIQVQNLAQAQSVSSAAFTNSATTVGNGSITIDFGSYSSDLSTFTANTDAQSVQVTIAPGSDSLLAICDAINDANGGVKAAIVQDNSGARITLTSTHTGESYAMKISSNITALNYDPTTANTTLTENLAAKNSMVLVNGITIQDSSNQLDDVITGISLNLKQMTTTQTISLVVENNQEQLTGSINEFVKKYNDCIAIINAMTGFDRDANTMGYFHRDTQVKALKLELYKTITGFVSENDSPLKNLRSIGIRSYTGNDPFKHGTLEVDQAKLSEAIKNNYASVGGLFAKTIHATDPAIQINSSDTDIASGSYDVSLSTFNPGVSMSGTIGGILGSSKDGITLTGGGKFKSLSIDILGGAAGDRGQIVITDGLASLIDKVLDKYVDKKGVFEERTNILGDKVKQLDKDQFKIAEKTMELKKKYNKQWNALDQLLGRMKDTSSMLAQVLDNLPTLNNKK